MGVDKVKLTWAFSGRTSKHSLGQYRGASLDMQDYPGLADNLNRRLNSSIN